MRDETVSRLGDQPIALPGASPSAEPSALDARLSQESPGKGCCRCVELSARIGRLQDEHRRGRGVTRSACLERSVLYALLQPF